MRVVLGLGVVEVPGLLVRWGSAVLAAALWLGGLDFALTRFVRKAPLTLSGSGALFPGQVVVLLVLGAGILAAASLAELLARRWGRGDGRRRAAWIVGVFCLVALGPATILGHALASGAWVAQQWFAPIVRYGVSLGAIFGVAVVTGLVHWTESKRYWPVAWLAASAAAAYVNAKVLLGLYPAFHMALYVFSATMSLLAAEGVLRRPELRSLGAHRWVVRIAVAAGVLLSVWGCLVMSTRSRGLVQRSSPQLAQVLTVVLPRSNGDVLRQAIDSDKLMEHARPARVTLGRKPKNVILILVDTLRGDALPPVRSKKNTTYIKPSDTPFFNEWLRSAYRFSNAYAQAPTTHLSVPGALYSHEVLRDGVDLGTRIASRARQLGLKPLAVLPEWYMRPGAEDAASLLEGFEWVETFPPGLAQESFRRFASRAIDATGDQPFFLWLHYYGMHHPYHIGKRRHPEEHTRPERYRDAVRYMDKQLKSIHAELSKKHKLDDTLIVLMADHGELLGERGLETHGIGINEEELHVPLAMWVPGAKSGDVHALVGNIDIVPTIFDLLQEPNQVAAQGRSLVPEMSTLAPRSDLALYAWSRSAQGLITQDHKLQFDVGSGSFGLFARADAAQANDLLGNDSELDKRLILEFARRNPALFQEELKKESTRQALRTALGSGTDKMELARLAFLLDVAALSEDRQILEQTEKAFDTSPDLERKMLVLSSLYATDRKHWSQRAQELLKARRSDSEDVWLVRALDGAGVNELEPAFVAESLTEVGKECGSERASAWLSLLDGLGGSSKYGPPLVAFLDCAQGTDPKGVGLLPRVLGSVESLEVHFESELESRILPLVRHKNDWVAVSSVRALGAVGGPQSQKLLEDILEGRKGAPRGSDRLVASSIRALTRLKGPALTPSLVKWGGERKRMFVAIGALELAGDQRAFAFLEDKAKSSDPATSRSAKAALAAIRARAAN